jgi:hypothetical protein
VPAARWNDDAEPTAGERCKVAFVERQQCRRLGVQRALHDDSVVDPSAGDGVLRSVAQERPVCRAIQGVDRARVDEAGLEERQRIAR